MPLVFNLFSAIYPFFARHRAALFAVTLFVIGLAAFVGFRGRMSEDIQSMLPDDQQGVAQDFRLLQQAPFTRNVVVSLSSKPGGDTQRLLDVTDSLANAMQPPLFNRVVTGPEQPDNPFAFADLARSLPALLTDNDLKGVAGELTEKGVNDRIEKVYNTLLEPSGWVLKPLLRSDPLNFRSIVFKKLESLKIVPDVSIESNHFVTRDGRNTLIVAETSATMTDSAESRKMIDHLQMLIGHLVPRDIQAVFVSGHRYTAANADVIKQDLARVITCSVVAMLFLFVFFLRNWRAIFVFLVPVAVLCFATAVVLLIYDSVSSVTIGFASVLLGITDDYPLHVYYAFRKSSEPAKTIGKLSRPMIFSSLTILGAFAALLFSTFPGQRQIAVFAITGILGSMALSLTVFPHVLKGPKEVYEKKPERVKGPAAGKRLVIVIWFIVLALSIWQATHIRFNGDLRAVSFVPASLREAEQSIQKTWGNVRSSAMIFSGGGDIESALRTNDLVFRTLQREAPGERVVSIAPLLPSAATQAANAERWASFWQSAQGKNIVDMLGRQSAALGFSLDAFSPFVEGLRAKPTSVTADMLRSLGLGPMIDSMIIVKDNKVNVLTLADDVPVVQHLPGKEPQAFADVKVVSPNRFREMMSNEIVRNFGAFVTIAFSVIALILFILFRDVRQAACALVPVVTGVLFMFGWMGFLGIDFNIFNIITTILVIGLAVDFGIFMCHRVAEGSNKTTDMAVLLGGLTTIAGIGTLVLARHPAMHSIGITVLLGLGGAIPAALFVIPALGSWAFGRKDRNNSENVIDEVSAA